MILTRRKLIGGLGLLVAAPAIVRASSIMKVKAFDPGTIPFEFRGARFQSVTWYRLRAEPVTLAQYIDCWNWVKNHPFEYPTAAGESAA